VLSRAKLNSMYACIVHVFTLDLYIYVCRYNVKEADTPEPPQEERSDPPTLAETCMRELVGRASFGHIRCVLRPVLRCVIMAK